MQKIKLLIISLTIMIGLSFSGGFVKADDIDGPALSTFSADPTTVNTGSESQTVTATFSVLDPSGVDYSNSLCEIYGDNDNQMSTGEVVPLSGDTYACAITLLASSAGGQWYFYLNFLDNVGNNKSYDAEANGNEILTAVPSATGTVIENTATVVDDVNGPTLTAFSADPTSVDTSSESKTVTATFTATDPSGVNADVSSCNLYSVDANQAQYGNVTLITGDQYSCAVTLPASSANGDWYFDLSLQDSLGNNSSYNAENNNNEILNAVTNAIGTIIDNAATVADTVGPTLTAFSAGPMSVDTSSESETVTATFTATDTTGMNYQSSQCNLYSADTNQSQSGDITQSTGDDYSCVIILPVGSASGDWYFKLNLQDNLSNNSSYDAGDTTNGILAAVPTAAGSIIANTTTSTDETGPALTAFSATPTSVDTSTETQTVTATFSVSDPAGFDYANSFCNIYGNNNEQSFRGSIINLTGNEYSCEIIFPIGSASGEWYFYFNFKDNFGNWNSYDAEANGDEILTAVPSAIGSIIINMAPINPVGPTLTAFSADSVLIDTISESRTITTTFTVIDHSGVEIFCGLNSENAAQLAVGTIANISGDEYSCAVNLPTGAARGKWYFSLDVYDSLGSNSSHYNAQNNGNEILTAVPGATGTIITNESSYHTISGTLSYYNDTKAIPNATVILEDDDENQINTTTTDSNGFYEFSDVPAGGNYVISVSKTDTATSNGINVSDVIKLRRHIVGLEIFNSIYKKIAADVNNDLSITVADIIKARRYITGIDTTLPSGNWKFYSSSATLDTTNYLTTGLARTYTNLTSDTSEQDFIGVKMGDVNDTWVSE